MRQADNVSPTEELEPQRSQRAGFRPDIEGLRAVAVLAVVLFHAGIPGVSGGFVGVDVFFVISGFLITGLLWREFSSTGSVKLRDFYGARARRLLPASATVGVFIMVSTAALLPVLQARSVIWDGIASALYVSNYRFMLQGVDYLAVSQPPSPFQHYWSLGVEEQFYLVWPALIIGTAWLLHRVRRRTRAEVTSSKTPYLVVLGLVAVVSFALSLAITDVMSPVAFFSLPTRAWQLAAGGLVALTAAQWQRLSPRAAALAGWAGLGTILLACTLISSATLYPGVAALAPTVGAVLVIGAGCATPTLGCGRLLGLAPMRGIGRISYSWYLWHWPILLVALWSVAPVTGHALELGLAGILISAGLAALTLRFIENPLRFAAPIRRSGSRSLALGGAATAVAGCVGLALLELVPLPVGHGPAAKPLTITASLAPDASGIDAYTAALSDAFAQVQAALAASADLKAVPSNLDPQLADAMPKGTLGASNKCFRGFFDVEQPECATGDVASATTVALVGDSNANMWSPAFQELAVQRHWRLETLTKAACPLLDLPITNPVLGREYTECDRWRGQTLTRLKAEHPRLVVLSVMRRYGERFGWRSGFTSYDPAWISSLGRMAKQLRDTGAQVLVLGPIPDPHSVVPDCLSGHLDNATACAQPRSKAVNESGIAAESAAITGGGGQYADLTNLFCTTTNCPVIAGNTLIYRDQNHVTGQYARVLEPVIGMLVGRTLAHG